MTAAEYILESIVKPGAYRAPGTTGGMPEGLFSRQEDIRQVVGFLATFGGTPRDDEIANLNIPDIVSMSETGITLDFVEVELGESIFRGKGQCATCHLLRAEPAHTLRGPSLLSVGTMKTDELRRAILEPKARSTSGYRHVLVQKKNGRAVSGRVVETTDKGLFLLTDCPDGNLTTEFFRYQDLEESVHDGNQTVTIGGAPSMPNYTGFLTEREIDALVAFLQNRCGSQDK
jgi:mono/diheme cytochrome c family protein